MRGIVTISDEGDNGEGTGGCNEHRRLVKVSTMEAFNKRSGAILVLIKNAVFKSRQKFCVLSLIKTSKDRLESIIKGCNISFIA